MGDSLSLFLRQEVSYALVHLRSTRARGWKMSRIPRLASLGWGYVHLCRDAHDLFRGRRRVRVIALSPGSLRSAGVTCISVEMLPTSSRPMQGSCYGFIPRLASLDWGYVHLCRDAPDLFEADAGFVLWLYPQARFARLGLRASLSRCSRPLRGRRCLLEVNERQHA